MFLGSIKDYRSMLFLKSCKHRLSDRKPWESFQTVEACGVEHGAEEIAMVIGGPFVFLTPVCLVLFSQIYFGELVCNRHWARGWDEAGNKQCNPCPHGVHSLVCFDDCPGALEMLGILSGVQWSTVNGPWQLLVLNSGWPLESRRKLNKI